MNDKQTDNLVFGKGPVLEVIENGKVEVNKIWISEGLQEKGIKDRLISFAKDRKIPFRFIPSDKLKNICNHKNHQGVVLSVSPVKYLSVDDIIHQALSSSSNVVLVAHEIEDVHNIGALVRTFVAGGGKGIILTGRKSAGITATVIKTSVGAVFQAQFARATNCVQVLRKLKDNSFWIVGTDNSEDSTLIYKTDFPDKIAIVVGNEHKGLERLVKENCDFVVRVPTTKKIDSLNVSVAFGIVLYEFLRQHTNLV